MRIVASVMLLLALVEAIFLFQQGRENHMLRGVASQVEALRSDLNRATESAIQHKADLQALSEKLARLEDELDRSKTAVNALVLGDKKQPTLSEPEKEVLPLGLTTNDVDLAGMLVRGTNTVGTLFIPLVGKCLERVREIRDKRQPLVFGWPISYGDQGIWGRDRTNVGFALHFSHAADAEAIAAKMRELGGGTNATN
jgi:hypothetical protein